MKYLMGQWDKFMAFVAYQIILWLSLSTLLVSIKTFSVTIIRAILTI